MLSLKEEVKLKQPIYKLEKSNAKSADEVLGKIIQGTTYTSVIFNYIDAFINEVLKKSIKYLKQVSSDSEEQMSSALNVLRVSKVLINYTYKATKQIE